MNNKDCYDIIGEQIIALKVILMTCFTIISDTIITTLEDTIKAAPAGTTSLYIHSRVYDALTIADVKASLRVIPPTIKHINIDGLYCDSDGRLRPYSYVEINEIYSALPPTITSLSFDTELPRDVNERIAIFSLIPAHVSAIKFGELHVVNLANIGALTEVIKNLPRTIKRLSFSGSALGRNSSTCFKLLFQALPEGILELDLSWCLLGQFNANDLAEVFSGLPDNLAMLELSREEFDNRNLSENKLIFDALPLSVLTAVNSECSSTLNLFLIESLKTFLDEVKAGHGSYDKIMLEIQVQAISLRQKSLPIDDRNRIRRHLQLLELKKQLLSYINASVNASYDFLAEWFQSERCMIENKQVLAVWSLYLSLKNQFSDYTNPIRFIALAELDFDNPKRFCAFLLWALGWDYYQDVQDSRILQHFFAYHLPFLGHEHIDTALNETYRILNQLGKTPVVKELLDYANSTHSGVRGAKVNYPLSSEAGLLSWQSSNLTGGDFEHHSELVVSGGKITALPLPTFPEYPDDIVKLYRWFGIEMLKRLDSRYAAHRSAFKLILMSDEGEALRQALPAFILRGEMPLKSAVSWFKEIVSALNETHTDISLWIARNPFYLYTICGDSSVINQLSAEQREQFILALQRQISESEVNSPSIILWVILSLWFHHSNSCSSIQMIAINQFILNQVFRFTSRLPDDVYSAVKDHLDIPENFMLDKLNQFKQELMASFSIDNFEVCKLAWGELRARVYTLFDLCPKLRIDSHYPVDIYEFKAFYIEEVWRQSGERFDLEGALSHIREFDAEQDNINKRVVLEALLFTQEPALQALFIQYLESHHIDWVNEKFGDDTLIFEKSITRRNTRLIAHILNSVENEAPSQEPAFVSFHPESKIVVDLANLYNYNNLIRIAVVRALFDAVEMGHLNIVKHLVHLSSDGSPHRDVVSQALIFAKEIGNWNIVKYLCSLTGDNRPTKDAVFKAFSRAVEVGQMDIVTQLVHLSGDNKLSLRDVSVGIYLATKKGKGAIATLLIQLPGVKAFLYNVLHDDRDDVWFFGLLLHAAAAGQLDIVMDLIHISGKNYATKRNIGHALRRAAKTGQLNVIQYLLHLTGHNKLGVEQIYLAAGNGCKLEIVTYLHDFLKTKPVDDFVDAYNKNPHILKSFDLCIAKTLLMSAKLPASAFEYLADSAKNDPEIILAVYHKNPNILPIGLGGIWMNLFNKIDEMQRYGEYLLEIDAEKGNECIELAASLKAQAFELIKNKHDVQLLQQSMQTFADILISRNDEMGLYRMNVQTLIINIVIAVISLPILCLPILIKLLHSYHNEDRFLFFGQSSKTTREEKIVNIHAGLEEVEQECGLSAPS